jgi:hypothetical protein
MSRSSTYVIDTSSMAIKEAEIEEGGGVGCVYVGWMGFSVECEWEMVYLRV